MRLVWIILVSMLVLTGCRQTEETLKIIPEQAKEAPEQAAQKFAVLLQQGQFVELYDLFIPELKKQRTQEDFGVFARTYFLKNKILLIYDKVVVQDDNTAYAYYTASSEGYEQKLPAITMTRTPEGWRFDALTNLFTANCAEPCDGYWRGPKCAYRVCNKDTDYSCKEKLTEPDCDCSSIGTPDAECPLVVEPIKLANGAISTEKYHTYNCVNSRCVLVEKEFRT